MVLFDAVEMMQLAFDSSIEEAALTDSNVKLSSPRYVGSSGESSLYSTVIHYEEEIVAIAIDSAKLAPQFVESKVSISLFFNLKNL